MKKDAGRTRWSQYFRSMKGGSSPRHEKLHDKDDKMDLESNFSHTHGKNMSTCYQFAPLGGAKHIRGSLTVTNNESPRDVAGLVDR